MKWNPKRGCYVRKTAYCTYTNSPPSDRKLRINAIVQYLCDDPRIGHYGQEARIVSIWQDNENSPRLNIIFADGTHWQTIAANVKFVRQEREGARP